MSDLFAGARLVVVKVGSALLVDGASGELRREWLASLCADVAALKRDGYHYAVSLETHWRGAGSPEESTRQSWKGMEAALQAAGAL